MVFNCNKSVLENTSSRRFNLCSGTSFVYFYHYLSAKSNPKLKKVLRLSNTILRHQRNEKIYMISQKPVTLIRSDIMVFCK